VSCILTRWLILAALVLDDVLLSLRHGVLLVWRKRSASESGSRRKTVRTTSARHTKTLR
jgi:hypothetical protein